MFASIDSLASLLKPGVFAICSLRLEILVRASRISVAKSSGISSCFESKTTWSSNVPVLKTSERSFFKRPCVFSSISGESIFKRIESIRAPIISAVLIVCLWAY